MRSLHALGVRIAIDVFGAGYTSLAQLKNFPISELKFDKSFILTMRDNPSDALIVRIMIDLGHSLKTKVVAEGVETAHTAGLLTGYRCDIAQGYHLCRPVPAEALVQWYGERSVHSGAAQPSTCCLPVTAAALSGSDLSACATTTAQAH